MTDATSDHDPMARENAELRGRIAALEADHQQVEAALQESAEKLHITIDVAPVCIAMVGLDQRFQRCNQAFCAFLAYGEEELKRKTITEVTLPEDVQIGMADIRAIVKGEKKTAEVCKRYVRKDGTVVWGEVSINLVRNARGEPMYLLPVIRDITERKRAEEERTLSAERIQVLLHLNQMTAAPLQELTDFALQEAVRVTRSTIGYLAFLSEDEAVLTMHSWSRSAMAGCAITDKPIVYPVASTGLWGEAVRQRRPVITNDYGAESPLKKGCPQGHVAVTRHLNVPVLDGSRIVLVAGVGNKTEPYDESDSEQLTLLMEGLWRLIERQRSNEALRTETANLAAVFESSPVAMMVLDQTLSIIKVNAAAVTLCGGSEADVLHHRPGNALRCVHSAKDPRGCGYASECKLCAVRNGIEAQFVTGGALHGAELELVLVRDGQPRTVWLRLGAEPLLMNGHRHLCVALEDVSERKRADAEIRQLNVDLEQRVLDRTAQLASANQALSEENASRQQAEAIVRARNEELKSFAYTVSHDLKAPLRGIAGYANELERRHQEGLGERARFCIGQILTATRNLDHLIEDLLHYSRLDAETPAPTTVDLRGLVDTLLRDRHLILSDQHVEVAVEVPPLTLEVWERGLVQVLANLIDNAVKYSRKAQPPRLTITAEARPDQYRLTVADNGIGFDMKYHDRIFGLFNRLVRADEFEGTGAGLAIVKKVMDKLGGTLRAESAPGQGATFFVELPRLQMRSTPS